MRSLALLLLLGGAAAACSSADAPAADATTSAATTDAGSDRDAGDAEVDAGFQPVAHPTLPIIPNQGGPIVAHPDVITITWSADPIAADLETFDDWMVKSTFWKDMMAEWGVGPGTHGGTYRVPTAAPATIDETVVQNVIENAIAAKAIPAPSADRIYAVYPPSGTTVTNMGAVGCEAFQAYHYSFTPTGGGPLAIYAITPRCAQTQGMTALDYVTWGMSHEIMEAASDPDYAHPAFRIDQQSLATPELGENADLCSGNPTKVDGHMVTRNWSNAAAAKGERPCVPAPAGPGFGLFAEPGEISLAPGASTTVKVKAWSSAPMDAFDVTAYPMDPALTASLSAKKARNGDELDLTVTASAAWAEQPGANLVALYFFLPDYASRTSLIVHAK